MKTQTWLDLLTSVTICPHGEMCNRCCWLWRGKTDRHGYGKGWIKPHNVIVHRAIYKGHYNVTLIPSQLVLHTCDIKRCCNWWHLYIGDKRRNALDGIDRVQYATGQNHTNRKLTESQVYQIRRLYNSGGWVIKDLCEVFPVKRSVAQRILTKQDWAHLRGELLTQH